MVEEYIDLARSLGFTTAVEVFPELLVSRPAIRALCAPETCPNYGTNWICPPGSGSLEDLAGNVAATHHGLLVESFHADVDTGDPQLLETLNAAQVARLTELATHVRRKHPAALVLTTGGCHRCDTCTYPDAPCRFPAQRQGSLSAYGIDVGDLCSKAGVPYAFVPGKLHLVSVILY